MKQYNIIIVFSQDRQRVLMCSRQKEPYKGVLNFVGGKIELGENHESAAYRELWEETSIAKQIEASGDENRLLWVDVNKEFVDINCFAGEGNIYHMLEYIKRYAKQ